MCTVSTPPGPPFTRGGKVLVPPSVDPEGAGVEAGEPCAAKSSLPTADCLLRTVPPIGLVGPMSNYAAPPQLVENVPYRDIAEMHEFARRWRDEHRGKWFTVPKLSGFCLLMKRAVYEKIGGLDERFGLGFFDDDDLAERARRAGFELAVAHDLFVHHFGSRTFAGNGIDAGKLLDENARRFAEKWKLKKTNGKAVVLKPWLGAANGVSVLPGSAPQQRRGPSPTLTRSASEGGPEPTSNPPPEANHSRGRSAGAGSQESLAEGSYLLDGGPTDHDRTAAALARDSAQNGVPAGSLAGASASYGAPNGTLAGASGLGNGERWFSVNAERAARVSLTMIVKNEEDHLPHCLESVRGVFDEIVVVDTGSSDRTREIAREFGAKVFDFPWIDDFAAARNEALSHATGDYVFWLDADDLVEPAERVKLTALLAGLERPASRGTESTRPPVTPLLTRPAGDLSPAGRGDSERFGDENRKCSGDQLSPSPQRGEGRGEGADSRESACRGAPLTRPAGDLSPAGRGDSSRPGEGHSDGSEVVTGRLRRPLRLRSEPGWNRRRYGGRSYPALSPPRRCAMDLSGSRADPAGSAASERAGALD